MRLTKDFAENYHFYFSVNSWYLQAVKCNLNAINRNFGPIFSRIKSSHFQPIAIHLTLSQNTADMANGFKMICMINDIQGTYT